MAAVCARCALTRFSFVPGHSVVDASVRPTAYPTTTRTAWTPATSGTPASAPSENAQRPTISKQTSDHLLTKSCKPLTTSIRETSFAQYTVWIMQDNYVKSMPYLHRLLDRTKIVHIRYFTD